MDVAEASFNAIISQARIQFVVPIWQRLYSWNWRELNALWEDLMNVYEKMQKGEQAEHFMGALVVKTMEEKVGEMTRHVLIDGQQRLTTLLVICALIRDTARTSKNLDLAKEIEDTLLFNAHAKKVDDKAKLQPTEADRNLFRLITEGGCTEESNDGSQLYYAYGFFKEKLVGNEDKYDLEKLLNSIRYLKLVTINLSEKDNPNRIFETLNFRGKALAQSDLIRNYFMMAIKNAVKADQIYNSIWFPMQQSLGSETWERMTNLEAFLRHFLVMNNHATVKQDEMYGEMRDRLKFMDENQIVSQLELIRRYSQYYERALYPDREDDPDVAKGISRLNELKIGVHYPFLLKVYDGFKTAEVSKDDFCVILKTIESYVTRRFFERLPTNALNKLFASLCQLPLEHLASSLQKELTEKESWDTLYWPTDDDFKDRLCSTPIYKISQRRSRFVLETLEESFGHPEPVNLKSLTIEHIMPETLDDKWEKYLGGNYQAIYDKYEHTIGNLTLIAGSPNSSIKNKLFSEKKKEWYISSNVELTKEIVKNWTEWTETEISDRANKLAARAIKIWSRPE